MFHARLGNLAFAAALLAQVAAPTGHGQIVLAIDSDASQVVINVGKAGVLSFAGHIHEIAAQARGHVTFDLDNWQRSSIALEFNAASMRVTGKGEPPADVPDVQRTMLSDQVLDANRFPLIVFNSHRISVDARTGNTGTVTIEGELTLHGTTCPMTIRASATLDADGRLTARGSFSLNQTDFGIEPVTAVGGTVRVKDAVDVQFVLTARRQVG